MTRSIALTKMVSEAEVTTEQKHQRVVAWLTEVNRVLYRNVDLTVHAPRLTKSESSSANKKHSSQSPKKVAVHRLYTQADHSNTQTLKTRNEKTCSRSKSRERVKTPVFNSKTSQLPLSKSSQLPHIPKRQFSSSDNSLQHPALQRKASGTLNSRTPITSKVVKSSTKVSSSAHQMMVSSASPTTPTFRRRMRSSVPITAGT